MNLTSFEYVRSIARYGTISKAAEMLYISQPALSQSLAKLESDLGVKLFERHGNRMILTEAGAAFVEEGKTITQASGRLMERIKYISEGKKETIRLGVSRFYGRLPIILETFIRNHPGVQFEITEGLTMELERLFADGGLDLCIIPSSNFTDKYQARVLFTEELLIAVPPLSNLNQFAEEKNEMLYMDLSKLKDSPFVSLTSNQRVYDLGFKFCSEAGFKPNVLCTVFGYDTLLMLVSMGLGVGFVSSLQKNTLLSMQDPPKCYHIKTDLPVHRNYVLLTHDSLGTRATDLAESIVDLE